jgi:TPR repeat protein
MSTSRNLDSGSLPRYLMEAIKNNSLSKHLLEVQAWAAKGDVAACIALAHAYFYGGHGVDKNFVEARYWLERIAQEDDRTGFAPHRLGIIYYKGLDVQEDHHRAFKYFRRAALRGNTKSKMMVAAMQLDGDGTLKKPRSARATFYCCAKDQHLGMLTRSVLVLRSCVW